VAAFNWLSFNIVERARGSESLIDMLTDGALIYHFQFPLERIQGRSYGCEALSQSEKEYIKIFPNFAPVPPLLEDKPVPVTSLVPPISVSSSLLSHTGHFSESRQETVVLPLNEVKRNRCC